MPRGHAAIARDRHDRQFGTHERCRYTGQSLMRLLEELAWTTPLPSLRKPLRRRSTCVQSPPRWPQQRSRTFCGTARLAVNLTALTRLTAAGIFSDGRDACYGRPAMDTR